MSNAGNFVRRCLGLYIAVSAQFTLKLCVAARNLEKFTKHLILGVQGRSKSSMLIKLKSQWPVLVMISNMFVLICNRFHTRRVNNGKITSFQGATPLWRPHSRVTSSHSNTKFCYKKTRDLAAAHGKHFVILAFTVSIQHSSVTDGRRDGQTDAQVMAKTRVASCYRA